MNLCRLSSWNQKLGEKQDLVWFSVPAFVPESSNLVGADRHIDDTSVLTCLINGPCNWLVQVLNHYHTGLIAFGSGWLNLILTGSVPPRIKKPVIHQSLQDWITFPILTAMSCYQTENPSWRRTASVWSRVSSIGTSAFPLGWCNHVEDRDGCCRVSPQMYPVNIREMMSFTSKDKTSISNQEALNIQVTPSSYVW